MHWKRRSTKKTKNNVVALNVLFNSSDHFERRSTNNNTVVSQPSFFFNLGDYRAGCRRHHEVPALYLCNFFRFDRISTRNTQQTKLHNIL